ncbi:MAG: hypothetical protein ACI39N_07860 [Lachnospiraceae bacterium]
MEKIQTFAPIMIPTLCRDTHFIRCIESLKRNKYAEYTDLYIGLDYPAKDSHIPGYQKICAYLDKGIEGFSSVTILRHTENKGSSENSRLLREKIFESHDRCIFSEDDNEFSPNYLEYMNKCLTAYQDDDTVLAVTGFNYPIDTSGFSGTVYTNNIYFAAFGYGIWKEKWLRLNKEITPELLYSSYKNSHFMRTFRKQGANQYCNFVKGLLGYTTDLIQNNTLRIIDLSCGIYMLITGKKMIFPVVSKVRNWGYDGSGQNCSNLLFHESQKITHRNFNTDCQQLDDNINFEQILPEEKLSQSETNRLVADFFEISKKELLRVQLVYWFSRIVGIKLARRIISKLVSN